VHGRSLRIKGLDYVAPPWLPSELNDQIVAWGGEASAPIVAWVKEKPINHWIDILYLAERFAPKPSLIPADATQRALMIGLSHELCSVMGIGWNRRLQMFAPAYSSGSPPANISRMDYRDDLGDFTRRRTGYQLCNPHIGRDAR
jgi:hypothetical protein